MDSDKHYDDMTERLLEEQYRVVDFLPAQVPPELRKQYFAAEDFILESPLVKELYRKFAWFLLEMSCCFRTMVSLSGASWEEGSADMLFKTAADLGAGEYMSVLIPEEDVLIEFSGGDLYMTLFHPSERIMELADRIAASQGLFMR